MPLPKTQVWCLTPLHGAWSHLHSNGIRGTRAKTCTWAACVGTGGLLSCLQGWSEEQTPSPPSWGPVMRKAFIAGSLKLLSQFTGSLSTGCHPDECPGPSCGDSPHPQSPCLSPPFTPHRDSAPCVMGPGVSDVVLVTTRCMESKCCLRIVQSITTPLPSLESRELSL